MYMQLGIKLAPMYNPMEFLPFSCQLYYSFIPSVLSVLKLLLNILGLCIIIYAGKYYMNNSHTLCPESLEV